MFVRDMVKRPDNRALEKRPDAFSGIGVDFAANPLFYRIKSSQSTVVSGHATLSVKAGKHGIQRVDFSVVSS